MGLDMYLFKKTYVQNWEHNGPQGQHKISVKLGGKTRKDIKPERICYITEQVAYWRKFNALHNWIIQNCADGVDKCQEIPISKENLEDLLDVLKKVSNILYKSKIVDKVIKGWDGEDRIVHVYNLENDIMELLPPSEGFFFGSYEIDEWYKNHVENSIQTIKEVLGEIQSDDRLNGFYSGDLYYQASW